MVLGGGVALFPSLLAAQGRTNLVVISIDTLRADRLGAYGYRKARTPVLDGLAREGVRFERAFTAVPLTLPAHCSLFTGAYPPFHGVRDNAGYALPESQTTLAEIMKAAGYATAAVVGAYVLDSKFGLDQGFDVYHDEFDLTGREEVSPGYIQRPADQVVERAMQLLDGPLAGRPFFLWVHLYDPHDPYTPPEPYASRHPGRAYDAEIEFTDAQLGRLLQHLRSRSLYEKSLIVVVGDHGESLGEHGESKHGLFIYNSVLHVPLILRFPEGEHAGRQVGHNVSIVDVLPTIGQALGLARSAYPKVQGAGLLGSIIGKRDPRSEIYAESYYPRLQFGWSQLRALIRGNDKYILSPRPELYDLRDDFAESRNLAGAKQALAARLQDDIQSRIGKLANPNAASEADAKLDPETRQRLASLGYVTLSSGAVNDDDFRDLPDPKDEISTYNRLGRLFELESQGRQAEVIPAYEEILAQKPGLKLVRFKLAQAYFKTGRYQKALQEYKAVVDLAGENAQATFNLALTYLQLRRFEEASLGFRRTLDRDPEHLRARINLGVCLKNLGRFPEAITMLEEALRRAPNDLLALSNLGVSYSLAERHSDALRVLEKAVGLSPEDARLHANLGMAHRRAGNEDKAREELATARRLDPKLFNRPPRK